MMNRISAATLYNLVYCPHRVALDEFGDQSLRDPANPFVQLLWERGTRHEQAVISGLQLPFTDLKAAPAAERAKLTLEAMARQELLIYGGRIEADDLVGEPDLLRWESKGYVPIDIKSGSGEEGDEDEGKPKEHYAMQLGLYLDILGRLGRSAGLKGYVWDIHGQEVTYDFNLSRTKTGKTSLWEDYLTCLAEARNILNRSLATLGAYSSKCKECHWYTPCKKDLTASDDLTLITELGRSKRDTMLPKIKTVAALAAADPASFIKGKKTDFAGIGADSLHKFHARAKLLSDPNPQPYLKDTIHFPTSSKEIFFDIELDPMRDFCYMHGFIERVNGDNSNEQYIVFFADRVDPAFEEQVFREAYAYLMANPQAAVYYYSAYEKTHWRRLAQKYPSVCSVPDVEALFARPGFIDLYNHVVRPSSEWPTSDFSIKTLAKYLGFNWRDPHPSGAASIEWFDRWIETGDISVRSRILEYNEDDCRATRVLLDGIRALPIGPK